MASGLLAVKIDHDHIIEVAVQRLTSWSVICPKVFLVLTMAIFLVSCLCGWLIEQCCVVV